MLNLYGQKENHLPLISKDELSDEEVIGEIQDLKARLSKEVLILGHHYQNDDIIRFADVRGDSLKLAQEAKNIDRPTIIFCGVHFMAETADILKAPHQQVILPDLNAGCTMADMAPQGPVEKAYALLEKHNDILPVTYINCAAALKSFVGEKGGVVCTSSNAHKIIKWAMGTGKKLFFFPDQHLGRNTCFDLGIPLEKMLVYNPFLKNGGHSLEQLKEAQVYLWAGHCSVHQGFKVEHIKDWRQKSPNTEVIVHPECSFDVVQASDFSGSTSQLIKKIQDAPNGSSFAVGTEINLVNRLNKLYPKKNVQSLSPYQCLCTTMYRVRPRWLLATLRSVLAKKPINVIKVPEEIKGNALKSIERMFALS